MSSPDGIRWIRQESLAKGQKNGVTSVGRSLLWEEGPQCSQPVSTRIDNTRPEILEPWFAQFKQLLTDYKVDVANIWNMDESGIGIGCSMLEC